ncbi:MAG TPA: hypothetical protein VM307_11270, partial [Egibacteraceae bacterium]|nr:hypothetical protein [Egibacteraceae bacterium]
MATVTPPDEVETGKRDVEATRAISRGRGLTKLSRFQTLGIFFGLLGVVLVAQVATALPGDDITLVLGLGEVAPRITLDPPNTVLGIGVLFVIAAIVALADRWTGRYAPISL